MHGPNNILTEAFRGQAAAMWLNGLLSPIIPVPDEQMLKTSFIEVLPDNKLYFQTHFIQSIPLEKTPDGEMEVEREIATDVIDIEIDPVTMVMQLYYTLAVPIHVLGDRIYCFCIPISCTCPLPPEEP